MAEQAGLDVDARFLLANERTLLAWIRTSLTFMAAGIGTLQLLDAGWRTGPGLVLLALGAFAAQVGLARYRRADSAIRDGVLPPRGRAPVVLAAGVAVVGVALTLLSAGSEVL